MVAGREAEHRSSGCASQPDCSAILSRHFRWAACSVRNGPTRAVMAERRQRSGRLWTDCYPAVTEVGQRGRLCPATTRRGPRTTRLEAMMIVPSYAHGASAVPLLGETIGENLRRTVERHRDRDALVVRSQGYRATYREL